MNLTQGDSVEEKDKVEIKRGEVERDGNGKVESLCELLGFRFYPGKRL